MRECPYCAENISYTVTVCPHCESQVLAEELPQYIDPNELIEFVVNSLAATPYNTSYLFCNTKLSEKQKNNIPSAFGSSEGEYPILLLDDTAFTSGKAGLLLTERAVYYNLGGKQCIPWEEVKSCSTVKNKLLINDQAISFDLAPLDTIGFFASLIKKIINNEVDTDPLMLISTTNTLEGYSITKYCGTVSTFCLLKLDVMQEFAANIGDWWGGKSKNYRKLFADLQNDVEKELKILASDKGGNAVVGASFEVEFIETSTGQKRLLSDKDIIERKLMVYGAGTAVSVKKIKKE